MKNSLIRLLQAARNKKVFKANQGPSLTEEMKEEIKKRLLALVQDSTGMILGNNSYEQLTLVACIFVKYDFPAQWPQLNAWLLTTFEQLYTNIEQLQIEQIPNIQKFLKFYLEVMKEQNKKKLSSSKGQFYKVAREHLRVVYNLWNFFNEKQASMIYVFSTDNLNLQNFNQSIFDLASKLDKCLLIMIACGFSLNELLSEPQNNLFVRVTTQLIQKMKFFSVCVEKLSQSQIQQVQYFYELFQNQIKTLLKHISELQYAESLIVYVSLGLYIETVAQLLFRGNLYNEKIKRSALFALYRVVNTMIYNQSSSEKPSHSEGIGILVSPSKFKNFEPQLLEAGEQYKMVFEKSDPTSRDPKVQNRKDGARELLKLVFQHYLPLNSFKLWKEDPEQFIELEDENFFLSEYDLDSAYSISLLAYQFLEKLIFYFYKTCYQCITEELLPQYFNRQLQFQDELVEDALFSLTGMLGRIQKDHKISQDKRLDITYVLDFIYQHKWSNPIFKRRFTHILTQWAKLLPKAKFMDYYRLMLTSLSEITDYVLIYEHCNCLHEMVKELDLWLQKTKDGKNSKFLQGALFDFNEGSNGDDEEDQIKMSIAINRQIDYASVFQLVAQKLIPILGQFKAPSLVWNMINYICKLLEKNSNSQEIMVECFNTLNLHHLLVMDSNLVDEAIVDMLKNLLMLQPESSIILQICISLLDYKLERKPEAIYFHFWLFTTRAVSDNNQSIRQLYSLFQKYSVYGETKKDYIFIDFLKIIQEQVLLNSFATQQDIISLLGYISQKMLNEIDQEKQWLLQNSNKENVNALDDASDSSTDSSNIYEKKLNLIMIPHILLQKVQTDVPETLEFIMNSQQQFLVMMCTYMVECHAQKSMPSSSTFFTQLLTYINRFIVIKRDFVIRCIEQMYQEKGYTFQQFVEQWFAKMDLLVSQEAKKINLLAIYSMLPLFTADMIQLTFNEIARLTFSQLDKFMVLKISNNASRFCSPSKVEYASYQMNLDHKIRVNQTEKISHRLEALKKEDNLLNFDIVEHFWQKMEQVKKSLNIQSLEPLQQLLIDEGARFTFANLISGNYQVVQH